MLGTAATKRRHIDGVFEQHGARKRSTSVDEGQRQGDRLPRELSFKQPLANIGSAIRIR